MNDALYLRAVGIAAAVQPDYSFSLPAVRALARMGRLRLEKPVTFLVGENGTGKSTLLEAIAAAWGFNPEGGTRNFRFSTARTHAELYRSLVLQRGPRRPRDGFFLRAESFYNVATEIDRLDEIAPLKGAYGGRSLHEQSHGESFLALVLNRFSGSGLYLLDEPEAALSPARQLALLAALDGLVRKNSQFLIATHSPLLLAYPNAEIFVRKASLADNRAKNAALSVQTAFFAQNSLAMLHRVCAKTCRTKRPPKAAMSQRPRPKPLFAGRLAKKPRFPANPDALALPGSCFSAFCLFLPGRKPVCGTVPSMCPLFFRFLFCNPVSNHL